jgi:hypothetical protein
MTSADKAQPPKGPRCTLIFSDLLAQLKQIPRRTMDTLHLIHVARTCIRS